MMNNFNQSLKEWHFENAVEDTGVVAVSLIFMHIHTSKKPVYLCTIPRLSQIRVPMVNQHKVSLLTIDVRTRKESSLFDSTRCLSFNKNEDRAAPLNYILIRRARIVYWSPNKFFKMSMHTRQAWSSLSLYDLFCLDLKKSLGTYRVLFKSIE